MRDRDREGKNTLIARESLKWDLSNVVKNVRMGWRSFLCVGSFFPTVGR